MILVRPSFIIDPGLRSGDEILNRLRTKANTCYKPEKISPKSDYDFMWELVHNKKHTSVLRHEQASFKLICSRAVANQIVRHGLAHFLQESQRYCNYSKKNNGHVTFVIPHWVNVKEGVYEKNSELPNTFIECCWFVTALQSEEAYLYLINSGCKPEQARESLINSCKTEVEVTANLEEMRHIFKARTSEHADEAMRFLMKPLLEEFKKKIPVIFDDI